MTRLLLSLLLAVVTGCGAAANPADRAPASAEESSPLDQLRDVVDGDGDRPALLAVLSPT